ncbi:DNA recombination protein RecN [Agreia sp. Leaf283]|uniref:DNA recombination protein RecN n=1 Tax=Agreia sp. Leaf283 TaxID=1736321 RepID=UPI000AC96102|nr:DNA recombination protein RecN [Agreia sp. Leaf283]
MTPEDLSADLDRGGDSGDLVAGGASSTLNKGIRIRRLRLLGVSKPFEVDFRDDGHNAHRALSIIAGRTNTGKTSVFRFIEYALGGTTFPNHTEVQRQVRSVAVEVQTPDGIFTLERALGAKNAILFPSPMDALDNLTSTMLVVDPISDPQSVSQWLLTTVGLQDVKLKEAPTKDDSGTDTLGFRDLLWLCLFYNERVGSQQLLHVGHTMKEIKLRQVVDAVFGVHDNDQAELARRVKEAQTALDYQRRSVESLQEFVSQQQPKSLDALELEADDLDKELSRVSKDLRALTQRELAASDFAAKLRQRHAELAGSAADADALVRDRASLVDRFASLRAQYADDIRKLTLLAEAESVFDQLSVTTCPVCFNPLPSSPTQEDGVCSLCHQPVHPLLGDENPNKVKVDGADLAGKELRAARRRYKELDEYWQRLNADLPRLRDRAAVAADAESKAGRDLDDATLTAVNPFLGERDELQGRRQAILVLRNDVTNGIKLRTGLDARMAAYDRARRNLDALRKEQRDTKARPDRGVVLQALSSRYSQILHEIEYPKVDERGVVPPYIDDKLVPHVRSQHFREASSGGQVLVSLAWMLAIFETAYETNEAHPGFLMIDTPQKNLGGLADEAEFADIHLVERVYTHLERWLSNAGQGAQVLIVDNTPPSVAEANVVVRYTRDPQIPPFGLIDNEVGAAPVVPRERDIDEEQDEQ